MIQAVRVTEFAEISDQWLRLFCNQINTPFQSFPYNQLFINQFTNKDNIYLLKIIDNEEILSIAAFERLVDKVVFVGMQPVLGKEEITDYGDILVDRQNCQDTKKYRLIWEAIFNYFKDLNIPKVQLDYVREDSQIWQALREDTNVISTPVEVAPWIRLDQSWDEYLISLKRVDRKELKRKLKRIESQPFQLEEMDIVKKEDFDKFISLHKLSDTAKDKFMTDAMADFFWQVSQLTYACWRTKMWFLVLDKKKVAAAIGFVSDERILMYNSGFNPEYGYYSVGLIMHALIMKKYFGSKFKQYDFMRGSERYKYDLGATNLQLYRLLINIS